MSDANHPLLPFRNRGFSLYWIAGLQANFAWQIQIVGASWMMISLGASENQVALMHSAVALPVMLLSMPGGALADLIGKRNLALWAQLALIVGSTALAAATLADVLSPALLLSCTLLLGAARALYYPGWQAMVFEFFPRNETSPAVALNTANINIARTLGPAIGAAVVAILGAFATLAATIPAAIGVILVTRTWSRREAPEGLAREPFGTAIVTGIRYILLSPMLVRTIIRSFIFNVAAIAPLALMPLVARDSMNGGPGAYGALLAAFGVGGLIGVASSGWIRRRIKLEPFVAVSL